MPLSTDEMNKQQSQDIPWAEIVRHITSDADLDNLLLWRSIQEIHELAEMLAKRSVKREAVRQWLVRHHKKGRFTRVYSTVRGKRNAFYRPTKLLLKYYLAQPAADSVVIIPEELKQMLKKD